MSYEECMEKFNYYLSEKLKLKLDDTKYDELAEKVKYFRDQSFTLRKN